MRKRREKTKYAFGSSFSGIMRDGSLLKSLGKEKHLLENSYLVKDSKRSKNDVIKRVDRSRTKRSLPRLSPPRTSMSRGSESTSRAYVAPNPSYLRKRIHGLPSGMLLEESVFVKPSFGKRPLMRYRSKLSEGYIAYKDAEPLLERKLARRPESPPSFLKSPDMKRKQQLERLQRAKYLDDNVDTVLNAIASEDDTSSVMWRSIRSPPKSTSRGRSGRGRAVTSSREGTGDSSTGFGDLGFEVANNEDEHCKISSEIAGLSEDDDSDDFDDDFEEEDDDQFMRLRRKRRREKRAERTLPHVPKTEIMGELRKILDIVAHVTDEKVLRNWPALKYGFQMKSNSKWMSETWLLTGQELKRVFASFRGSDAFRRGDMARISRLLGIHRMSEERLHDFKISYDHFTKCLGERTSGGGTSGKEPEGVDDRLRENSNTCRQLYLKKEDLFKAFSKDACARARALPAKHRIALAKEAYESGLLDIELWERMAFEVTLKSFMRASCKILQPNIRGFLVRNSLREAAMQARGVQLLKRYWFRQSGRVVVAWREAALAQIELRERCLRPFFMWRRFTARNKHLRQLTVGTFWPLYVWRRYTRRKVNARAKAKFLKRVWIQLRRLRFFRTWGRYTVLIRERRQTALKLQRSRTAGLVKSVLLRWHVVASKQKRRVALVATRRKVFRPFMSTCFAAWRYFALGRRLLVTRALKYRWLVPMQRTIDRNAFSTSLTKIPNFPTPESLGVEGGWNSGFETKELARKAIFSACAPMLSAFEAAQPLYVRLFWYRTRLLAPRCMSQWRHAASLNQKERKLRYLEYTTKLRHFFQKFRRAVDGAKRDRFAMKSYGGDAAERQKRHDQRRERDQKHFLKLWKSDREWREQGMMNTRMIKMSVKDMSSLRRRNTNALELHRQRLDIDREESCNIAKSYLETEEARTSKIVQTYAREGADLYDKRYEIMRDTLCKITFEVNQAIARNWVKKCFNRLSLFVRNRRALRARRRGRLRNWLRICVRRNYLLRSMPTYRMLRNKWAFFNRWLKYMDKKYNDETPGLCFQVKRRSHLATWYSRCLCAIKVSQILAGGSRTFIEDDTSSRCLHSRHVVLARWQRYTQERVAKRRIELLMKRLAELRLKKRVVAALRTHLRPQYTFQRRMSREISFAETRVLADLNRWRHSFFAALNRSYDTIFANRRREYVQKLHSSSLEIPTLKKLLCAFDEQVTERLKHEQRLLCILFKQRRKAEYGDFCIFPSHHRESGAGEAFVEPGLTASEMKLAEIDVTCESGGRGGVVAIARIVNDGSGSIVRGLTYGRVEEKRGAVNNDDEDQVEHHNFVLDVASVVPEYLLTIEGYCTPNDPDRGLGAGRFGTRRGRVSPWYGRDKSGTFFKILANTLRSSATQADVTGEGSQKTRTDENSSVTTPVGWIVGFCGRATSKRIVELGCVAHQKLPPNVLGNCWVGTDDALVNATRAEHHAENDFAVLLQMRASDIRELSKRTTQIAKRMRATRTGLKGLDSVETAFKVAKWFFESQSRGLVACPSKGVYERAESIRFEGQAHIRRGESMVSRAEEMLRSVDGYDPRTGVAKLNVAMIGMAKVRKSHRTIDEANRLKRKGLVFVARGQAITLQADRLLPTINADRRGCREYFERLHTLAHVANTLTTSEEALLKELDGM